MYPLPRVKDLFANLAGGCSFTKLNRAQAYQQIHNHVTINTHKDLYRYTCLPFGVSAVPQRTMENLLQSMPYLSRRHFGHGHVRS